MEQRLRRLTPGLICVEFVLRPGERRLIEINETKPRSELSAVAVYVEGYFEILDMDGCFVSDRRPGEVNSERGEVPQGKFAIQAGEPGGRYYCFFPAKGADPFRHEVIRAKAGETVALPHKKLFFLCMGRVILDGESHGEGFAKRLSTEGVTVRAETDILAIATWRD